MSDETITNNRNGMGRQLQLEVRAQKILTRVTSRCIYLRDSSEQAARAYFEEKPQKNTSRLGTDPLVEEFLQQPETEQLDVSDLNRYSKYWKALIPGDVELRAAFIHLLAQKYPLRRTGQRKLLVALGFEDPQLQAAFQELYEQPLENIFEQGVDSVPSAAISPEEAQTIAFNEVAQEWDLQEEDSELEWISLPSGSVLYQPGEPGDSLYILISGRLRTVVSQGEGERVVADIGRGEMVGAIEVLTGEERSMRVYAVRDSELIRISQGDLQRLAEERPQIMKRMVAYLASRLKSQITPTRKSGNTLVSFALVRAGDPAGQDGPAFKGSLLADFPARFAEALNGYGPTLLLNSGRLDQQVGEDWAQTSEDGEETRWLAAYLSEQEAHYRYVVYETDGRPSPWTRRCLRQADRVLIVAESDADPRAGQVEAFLQAMEMPADAELALIHPDQARRPSGTQRWLENRTLKGHHHLRQDNVEDMNRLVRRLTGRALGLVLSGGGARGYAHIGVIRALREAGLQVDVAGGTSMGSIVAALAAMDLDDEEIMQRVRKFSSPSMLFDLTLPLVSFFKSEKITNVLKNSFGEAQIEDLWRPFFCLSSNLTRAKPNVHMQGSLWEAVRASSAIPGVFSPVLNDGELLVDGAVLNNLPVDVMQDFAGCGPIVAVNVFPEVDMVGDYHFGHSVSGWEVLLRRMIPFTDKLSVPLIFEFLLRVIALNDVHLAAAKSQMCELYIAPRVEQYGILEFQAYEQIIEIGYQSAREAIDAWSRGASAAVPLPERSEPVSNTLNKTLADLESVLDRMALAET
jgi:predicted acylesterase/phospholipase RssA/CRP-like cAMP-binding protein